MPTAETRQKVASGGVFFLPVLLVLVTGRMLAPSTVGVAGASTAPAPAFLVTRAPDAPPADPGSEAATARIAELRAEPFGPTPLYYRPRPAGEEPGPVEETSAPEFTVQAILSSSSGNTALIDGKAHRAGDQIGESGWVVVEVDARSRSVTIEDPRSGERVTRSVDASR